VLQLLAYNKTASNSFLSSSRRHFLNIPKSTSNCQILGSPATQIAQFRVDFAALVHFWGFWITAPLSEYAGMRSEIKAKLLGSPLFLRQLAFHNH
jgi:hypothetical protein